jgi:hypothetical protein
VLHLVVRTGAGAEAEPNLEMLPESPADHSTTVDGDMVEEVAVAEAVG